VDDFFLRHVFRSVLDRRILTQQPATINLI
jgi:hypothetical protein